MGIGMEKQISAAEGAQLITTAKEYIGVPFLHQGKDRRGLDCIGLMMCTARAHGYLIDVDPGTYNSVFSGRLFVRRMDTHLDRVNGEWQDGDIALFSSGMSGGRNIDRVRHCGFLYRKKGLWYMIHAYNPQQKVMDNRVDDMWMKLLFQVYRLKREESVEGAG